MVYTFSNCYRLSFQFLYKNSPFSVLTLLVGWQEGYPTHDCWSFILLRLWSALAVSHTHRNDWFYYLLLLLLLWKVSLQLKQPRPLHHWGPQPSFGISQRLKWRQFGGDQDTGTLDPVQNPGPRMDINLPPYCTYTQIFNTRSVVLPEPLLDEKELLILDHPHAPN